MLMVVLSLAACGPAKSQEKSMPAPVASESTSVVDDMGSVDQVSEDVSVDSLDDVDSGLSDVEQLDI